MDSVWEQKKLEATKKAKKCAAHPPSAARIVGRTHRTPTDWIETELQTHLENIVPTIKTFATTKKESDEWKLREGRVTDRVKSKVREGTELSQENGMKWDKSFANKNELNLAALVKPKIDLAREKRLDR